MRRAGRLAGWDCTMNGIIRVSMAIRQVGGHCFDRSGSFGALPLAATLWADASFSGGSRRLSKTSRFESGTFAGIC